MIRVLEYYVSEAGHAHLTGTYTGMCVHLNKVTDTPLMCPGSRHVVFNIAGKISSRCTPHRLLWQHPLRNLLSVTWCKQSLDVTPTRHKRVCLHLCVSILWILHVCLCVLVRCRALKLVYVCMYVYLRRPCTVFSLNFEMQSVTKRSRLEVSGRRMTALECYVREAAWG